MNIDLFISQEHLDKLVSNFIELQYKESGSNVHQRSKKEVVILNSILVTLNTQKNGLSSLLNQVKYALEVSSNDRKSMERAAQLLLEVNKRSPNLINKSSLEVLNQIVTLSCQKAFIAVCGNSFIAVLQQLFSSLSNSQQKLNQLFIKLIQFLTSPKLLVSTYRQQTRLCLYKLYLKGINFYTSLQKGQQQLSSIRQQSLVQKCIKSGSGEKDPRNIGLVFEIYLKILQMFPPEKLEQYRAQIFQNLQSYYPIQFVGDEDNEQHKKINLRQISESLDKCITHPFFKELTWQLFTTKLAAPPIAPFVSTFLLYLSRRKKDSSFEQFVVRLNSMLLRLSQQQYIEQDYPQGQPDLGNLLIAILQFIFYREDGTFTIQGYQMVVYWLQLMVGRVIEGECKHSGTMMGIFRCIVKSKKNKKSTTLVQLFRSFALRKIINIPSIKNEIIPKLGLAIVALAQLDNVNENLNELIGLLIIQVGRLYSQASDEVKMLLLKILLQIYQGRPENRVMVRKVNDSFILKDCLARAKEAFGNELQPTQIFLVKAFIDFIATVYISQIDTILTHIQGLNFELEAYLIARLLQSCNRQLMDVAIKEEKLQLIATKMNILIGKLKQTNQKDAIFNALKVIPQQCCLFLIKKINWFSGPDSQKILLNLYLQLKDSILTRQKDVQEEGFDQLCNQMASGILKQQQMGKSEITGHILNQQIWRKLANQQDNTLTFPAVNQFRNSLQQQNFRFEEALILGYQPTFIHWQWENLNLILNQQARQQRLSQLINYLPQKLLLKDSEKVLQFAIKNEKQTGSLLKVVKHLEMHAVKQTGIIQYCLQYLDQLHSSPNNIKNTERSTCVLAILIDLIQRDKQNELKKTLKARKRLLNNLLLHRKRPIRVGIRKMLLLMEE